MTYGFIGVGCFLAFVFIYLITKNKKPFKRAFLSMFSGVFALAAVNIIGLFCNISLPISPFTVTTSACGGVPAVAAMVLIGALM